MYSHGDGDIYSQRFSNNCKRHLGYSSSLVVPVIVLSTLFSPADLPGATTTLLVKQRLARVAHKVKNGFLFVLPMLEFMV